MSGYFTPLGFCSLSVNTLASTSATRLTPAHLRRHRILKACSHLSRRRSHFSPHPGPYHQCPSPPKRSSNCAIEVIPIFSRLVWELFCLGQQRGLSPHCCEHEVNGREDSEVPNIPPPLPQAQEVKRFLLELGGLGKSCNDRYVSGSHPEAKQYSQRYGLDSCSPPSAPGDLSSSTPRPTSGPVRPNSTQSPRLLTHVQHSLGSSHLAPALFRRKPTLSPPPSPRPRPRVPLSQTPPTPA